MKINFVSRFLNLFAKKHFRVIKWFDKTINFVIEIGGFYFYVVNFYPCNNSVVGRSRAFL